MTGPEYGEGPVGREFEDCAEDADAAGWTHHDR
jgi:hypothetical protein